MALFERTGMCGLGEEVSLGVAFEVSGAQVRSRGSADPDVELLTTSVALCRYDAVLSAYTKPLEL